LFSYRQFLSSLAGPLLAGRIFRCQCQCQCQCLGTACIYLRNGKFEGLTSGRFCEIQILECARTLYALALTNPARKSSNNLENTPCLKSSK
jgi:hypothetical protein